MIIEPYYEGMPAPDTYRFGGQEYKMNVRDTQIIDLDWGGKVVFVNCIVGGAIGRSFLAGYPKRYHGSYGARAVDGFVCSRRAYLRIRW